MVIIQLSPRHLRAVICGLFRRAGTSSNRLRKMTKDLTNSARTARLLYYVNYGTAKAVFDRQFLDDRRGEKKIINQ